MDAWENESKWIEVETFLTNKNWIATSKRTNEELSIKIKSNQIKRRKSSGQNETGFRLNKVLQSVYIFRLSSIVQSSSRNVHFRHFNWRLPVNWTFQRKSITIRKQTESIIWQLAKQFSCNQSWNWNLYK